MLLLIAVIILLILWLSGLTFLFLKLTAHYNHLIKHTHATSLQSILDTLLKETTQVKKDIEIVKKIYATIEKEEQLHLRKIGLLRFNPFKDTGGDQSFILALLDGNSSGVVISGLYSRSGTRWYAKRIVEGKGTEHELSEEEKRAISEAK